MSHILYVYVRTHMCSPLYLYRHLVRLVWGLGSGLVSFGWVFLAPTAFIFNHWRWTYYLAKVHYVRVTNESSDAWRRGERAFTIRLFLLFFSYFFLLRRIPFGFEAYAKYCLYRIYRLEFMCLRVRQILWHYVPTVCCTHRPWKKFQRKYDLFSFHLWSTIRLNSCLHLPFATNATCMETKGKRNRIADIATNLL